MRLEESDAKLFYQLWFPLLDFVNRKYHVCPETETIDQRQGVDARDAKAIADYLWSHTDVIEEYLAVAELPNEYAQIVAGWKQCKPGRYILERHLKKGFSIHLGGRWGGLHGKRAVLHLGGDAWRKSCATGCCVNSFPGQHYFGWAGSAISYLLRQGYKRGFQGRVHERKEKPYNTFLFLSE